MNHQAQGLKTDLIIHFVLFMLQMLGLAFGGFAQSGQTPPLIYPCWLILGAITLFRQQEARPEYRSNLIFVPSGCITLLLGFCLINEMTRDYWAFTAPRHFPVAFRIVWYQAVLLLIHPYVYSPVYRGLQQGVRQLSKRGYFRNKLWIVLVISALVLWFFRSQNISPDGYDWLKHSVVPKHWTRYLREPLGIFTYRMVIWLGMKLFHFTPYITLTLITIASGLISTILVYKVIHYAVPPRFLGLSLALMIGSCGYTQIFVGNIEIYALLHVWLIVFLYVVVRFLKNQLSIYSVGVVFGLLFCTHLSAGWWIPVFVSIPFLKWAIAHANEAQRGHESSSSQTSQVYGAKRAGFDTAKMVAACLSVCLLFGTFVLFYGYDGDATAMWNHFWGDEVMLVGADYAMFRPMGHYFSFDYYLTMVNEYFYLMTGGVVLGVVWIAGYRATAPFTPFQYWMLAMAICYGVYSLTWHPDRPFPADWDIFSAVTIPVMLLLSMTISRLRISEKAVEYILYQTSVFSVAYLIFQVLRNHLKVTDWPEYL